MPCSCGGMRRSGLAPSNVAIRQKQLTPVYTPPPAPAQIQRPTQPEPQSQTQPQPTQFQSNRPNFSGNLPRRR
jgi:hypothetical protein